MSKIYEMMIDVMNRSLNEEKHEFGIAEKFFKERQAKNLHNHSLVEEFEKCLNLHKERLNHITHRLSRYRQLLKESLTKSGSETESQKLKQDLK